GLGGGKLRQLACVHASRSVRGLYVAIVHACALLIWRSRRVVATNAGIAVQPVDVGVLDPRDRELLEVREVVGGAVGAAGRRDDIIGSASCRDTAGLPDLLHIVLLACAERAQVAKRPR